MHKNTSRRPPKPDQFLIRFSMRGIADLLKQRAGLSVSDRARPLFDSLKFGSDKQWCRIVMNRKTKELVSELSPNALSALEISGSHWKSIPFKSYRSVNYPEFNICEDILEERFDLIIAEQIFEHLLWPYRAARNIYRMLTPKGYFLLTTPFLIRIHNEPFDCTRWTETGIKYFLAECGFQLGAIRTGSWGNRKCVISNLSKWIRYIPALHSLNNEEQFPVVVWALATRP
jgi:SAM-dependent methyltransferase